MMGAKIKVPQFLLSELDRQIARVEATIKRKQMRLAELKATRANMTVETKRKDK